MNREVVFFSVALLAIVLLSLAVRIFFASEPLWIDELHTAWASAAELPLQEVNSRAGQGNQYPLYFAIVWTAQNAIGFSVFSLRATSIFASIATTISIAVFVYRSSGSAICGLLGGLLYAVDYWAIFYGTEARPYAMVQLLAVFQTIVLCHEFKRRQTSDASESTVPDQRQCNWTLAIATAALLLTHLNSIILIAAQLVIATIMFRRVSLRRILISFAIAFPVLAIGYRTYGQVLSNRSDWASVNELGQLLSELQPMLIPYFIVPLTVAGLSWILHRKSQPAMRQPLTTMAMFAGITAATLAAIFILHQTQIVAIASYRYISFLTPLMIVAASMSVALLRGRTLRIIFAIAIFSVALFFNPLIPHLQQFPNIRLRHEDWHAAVHQLNSLDDGDKKTVFLFSNLVEDHRLTENPSHKFIEYLRFPLNGAYRIETPARIVPMPTITRHARWQPADLNLMLKNGGCFILVRSSKETLDHILDELNEIAGKRNLAMIREIYEQDNNSVRLVQIEVTNE